MVASTHTRTGTRTAYMYKSIGYIVAHLALHIMIVRPIYLYFTALNMMENKEPRDKTKRKEIVTRVNVICRKIVGTIVCL